MGETKQVRLEWRQRLEFVEVRVLRKEDMGSAMSDLMKVLRLGSR